MDRLTRRYTRSLTGWKAAGFMLMAAKDPRYAAAIDRAIELSPGRRSRIPNAVPVLKYWARVRLSTNFGVDSIRAQVDPYSPARVWVFDGGFGYDADDGGYVPFGEEVDTTVFLKNFYEAANPDRIWRAWLEMRRRLRSPSGGVPVLVHDFENPHVYFMRRATDGLIKIGVSIHPGIRRKQLMAQYRAGIEIVHIISSAGYEEERNLHRRFAGLRADGEWFRPAAELVEFIRGLQQAA